MANPYSSSSSSSQFTYSSDPSYFPTPLPPSTTALRPTPSSASLHHRRCPPLLPHIAILLHCHTTTNSSATLSNSSSVTPRPSPRRLSRA
ncbi:hypothetical protein S245_000520 [Arachis hypogaea]